MLSSTLLINDIAIQYTVIKRNCYPVHCNKNDFYEFNSKIFKFKLNLLIIFDMPGISPKFASFPRL